MPDLSIGNIMTYLGKLETKIRISNVTAHQ